MKFLGIDLHSNCFTCCIIYEDGKRYRHSFSFEQESLNKFYQHLDEDTHVIIEASTNTFKFVELIKDMVKDIYVANTHKVKAVPMEKKKTDKVDAERLAMYLKMQVLGRETLAKPVYVPENTIQNLRSLFSTYKLIGKQIVSTKNRIHALLKQNLFPFTKIYIFGKAHREAIQNLEMDEAMSFQIRLLFKALQQLEGNKEELKKKILTVGSEYINEIDILTSMKGISVFTAIALMADIATVERFPNSKHFTSYLRSAPGVESSNETTRITNTNKSGRKLSVTLISQSLNHFRDSNLKLSRWYDKKAEYINRKGKIRMALCRRVFAELYQMLKKQQYHYFRDEKNHLKKMNEYCKFLEKNNIIIQEVA